MAIGGTVTRVGAPLARGLISFRPVKGGSGPAATTGIHEGRYQFDSRNGPSAGLHDVIIQMAIEGKRMDPPQTPPPGETTATADTAVPWTFEIDVPAEAPSEIPFKLP